MYTTLLIVQRVHHLNFALTTRDSQEYRCATGSATHVATLTARD